VLVEGSLVSSTYEQPNGKGKKSKATKITSWSIHADVVRKLDRNELEPQAVASETSRAFARIFGRRNLLTSGLEKALRKRRRAFPFFSASGIAVEKRKFACSLAFPGIAALGLAPCISGADLRMIAGFVPISGDAVCPMRKRASATDSAPTPL